MVLVKKGLKQQELLLRIKKLQLTVVELKGVAYFYLVGHMNHMMLNYLIEACFTLKHGVAV